MSSQVTNVIVPYSTFALHRTTTFCFYYPIKVTYPIISVFPLSS